MQFTDTLYGAVKNGVLVLSGFVASVTVEHGSLVIKDGIKGNVVERTFGLARCPISRLISTQSEGFISFSAVRWLHGIGATVAHLNYDGAPLLVSAPQPVVSAGLRRKQALTTRDTTLGKAIIHRLLEAQLSAQIDVLQHLDFRFAAKDAQKYASRLTDQLSADDMLGIEGMTAKHYWTALADIPVRFGVKQGVPNYWRSFGTRVSPITGTPRTAVTPAEAPLTISMVWPHRKSQSHCMRLASTRRSGLCISTRKIDPRWHTI